MLSFVVRRIVAIIRASSMIVEAILSFIGAGVPPSTPSWGNIMAEGRALWQVRPHIILFPAVFLSITVLAVNMLGDGLRDSLDPNNRKKALKVMLRPHINFAGGRLPAPGAWLSKYRRYARFHDGDV